MKKLYTQEESLKIANRYYIRGKIYLSKRYLEMIKQELRDCDNKEPISDYYPKWIEHETIMKKAYLDKWKYYVEDLLEKLERELGKTYR